VWGVYGEKMGMRYFDIEEFEGTVVVEIERKMEVSGASERR
jgi:hypothetical protein